MIAIVKISTGGQTIIPPEVCAALRVGAGDVLTWEVNEDGSALVRRGQALDFDYLKSVEASLGEWSSPEDEEAYRDL